MKARRVLKQEAFQIIIVIGDQQHRNRFTVACDHVGAIGTRIRPHQGLTRAFTLASGAILDDTCWAEPVFTPWTIAVVCFLNI